MQDSEREMLVTAMVTVTIPVGLAFYGPVSWDTMRRAALENFLDHPAINPRMRGLTREYRLDDIEGFIDRIEVTHG